MKNYKTKKIVDFDWKVETFITITSLEYLIRLNKNMIIKIYNGYFIDISVIRAFKERGIKNSLKICDLFEHQKVQCIWCKK